jgi:hypothetical protein
MKIVVGILAGAFSVYTAVQSFAIAHVGVTVQSAQLEGDGGGGLLFALLCLVSGVVVLAKPFISVFTFVVSAVVTIFVGMTYSDDIMIIWSVVPIILAATSLYMHYSTRRRHRTQQLT